MEDIPKYSMTIPEVEITIPLLKHLESAFERYQRVSHEYPHISWDDKTVENYESDKAFLRATYQLMKFDNPDKSYEYAMEESQKRLFMRIVQGLSTDPQTTKAELEEKWAKLLAECDKKQRGLNG